MDEVILAFLVCVLPLGMVGGLVVWLVRGGRQASARQVAELESELQGLRAHNQALTQRVQHLEVGLTRVYNTELPTLSARLELLRTSAPRPDATTDSEEGSPASASTPSAIVSPADRPDVVAASTATAPIADTAGAASIPDAGTVTATGAVSGSAAISDPVTVSDAVDTGTIPSTVPVSGSTAASGSTPTSGSTPASDSVTASGSVTEAADSPVVPADTSSIPASPASPGAPPDRGAPPRAPDGGWEQWIGVRGAAALGALVLVLAGLYFFQYSIEHGLLSPPLRLVLGVGVGLGCIAASELRLRHRHATLAQWLTGAGIAILYVAFWAGRALYELYPSWAASLAMIATTGACVALATARRSVVVAALGLLGGFVTPLALSTGQDRPVALFGYLLVLDGAMLWLAYRRRWAWLALASLVGTGLYQVGWILARLDEPRALLGAAIVAIFALLFAALPPLDRSRSDGPTKASTDAREPALWRATRVCGLLLALLLAIHLSLRGDLTAHYAITAPLLLALAAASAWVGARRDAAMLPLVAAVVVVGSLFGEPLRHAAEAWQLVGLVIGLALVFFAATELGASRRAENAASPDTKSPTLPNVDAAFAAVLGGLGVILVRGSVDVGGPWPWVLAIASLTLLGLRLARLRPVGGAFVGFFVGLDAALVILPRFGSGGALLPDGPRVSALLGLALALATLPSALSLVRRTEPTHRRYADLGALLAILIVPFVLPFAPRLEALPEVAFFGGVGLACTVGALAAWRLRSALALLAVVLVHAWATSMYVVRAPVPLSTLTWLGALLPALFGLALALVPTTTRAPEATSYFPDDPWRWRAAALASPLAFPAAYRVHLEVFGRETIGLVAIALASVAALVLALAYRRGPRDAGARRTALAWAAAASSGLVTVAIPVQLENEWITIGWSLEALALALVWRRLDHAGLKYFALALVTLVGIRLVGNPYVLDYYPRGAWRVLNWLSYTYLVPSLALVGTWKVLHEDERSRLRAWEKSVFGERAFVATFSAATAIAVVFVWINLTIFDVFAEGSALTVSLDRLPARDLSLSVAWGLYALTLLALGMRRRVLALRITSLVLVLVTSGKVFLYDLAYLRDLYRVASLVGLALSLIAISFVYQRFVFREKARATDAHPRPEAPR